MGQISNFCANINMYIDGFGYMRAHSKDTRRRRVCSQIKEEKEEKKRKGRKERDLSKLTYE